MNIGRSLAYCFDYNLIHVMYDGRALSQSISIQSEVLDRLNSLYGADTHREVQLSLNNVLGRHAIKPSDGINYIAFQGQDWLNL